jgi:hypothetical protein
MTRRIEDQKEYETHVKKHCWREECDEPFSIDFDTTEGTSVGLTLSDLIRVSGERSQAILGTIQGQAGRRMKIRDPEAFLDDVMKQEGVDRWIRTHASVARKSHIGRTKWKAPELWMVTGVQHVTGGEMHFEGSSTRKFAAQGGGDASMAVGAPPGTLKFDANINREKTNGAKNDFGHEDERVWAAQFMRITIEFGRQEDAVLTNFGSAVPKTIAQFKLEDVPDLGARGIRDIPGQNDNLAGPVPKLIGRITTQQKTLEDKSDAGEDTDPEGIVIDDKSYVSSIQEADWDMYETYTQYIKDAEKSRQKRTSPVSV